MEPITEEEREIPLLWQSIKEQLSMDNETVPLPVNEIPSRRSMKLEFFTVQML
jgi:hypothetical protein